MKAPNQYRIRTGPFASKDDFGPNGYFLVPFENSLLVVIASDGMGWDHVSVSLKNRAPNWREMTFIKDLFFDPEETVIQFHPKKSEYVNNHDYCLHIWKKQGEDFELPPSILVGVKI